VTYRYKIDFVAEYQESKEDLILHWGVGRRAAGEWTSPDDKHLPPETTRFTDGKACQTLFLPHKSNPIFREIHMEIAWVHEVEQAIKSLNYVVMEPSKNWWHNNGG